MYILCRPGCSCLIDTVFVHPIIIHMHEMYTPFS